MPKRTYEATFYYQVTLVREGTIQVEVPNDAAPDYNPFDGKSVAEALRFEGDLGEAEMIVDDETPEGERLMDILLNDPQSGELVRVTRSEDGETLEAAGVEFEEE